MSLVDFYFNIIKSFNKNHVEYMLVGGHAVNFHGFIRATLDLDLWINPTEQNYEFLKNSFLHLGYEEQKCDEAIKNLKKNHIIKIPGNGNMIDLFDSFIMKADFNESFPAHEILKVKNIEIKVIGLEKLIEIKHKSNRAKDLLDVKELKKIKNIKKT